MPEYESWIRYAILPKFSRYIVGADGSLWSSIIPGKKAKHGIAPWHRIKASPDPRGYLIVAVSSEGKPRRTRYLHGLILEAFIGPRPAGMQCRHLNGIAGDCRLENLCWGTPKENGADKLRHQTHAIGERNGGSKISQEQCEEVRKWHKEGVQRKEILARVGISPTQYYRIIHNQSWHDPAGDDNWVKPDKSLEPIRDAALARGYHLLPIPGFPGYHADTNGVIWTAWFRVLKGKGKGIGPVYAIHPIRRRPLKPTTTTVYPQVLIKNEKGRGVHKNIHVLILITFVGTPPAGHQCRHLNDIKTDSRLANLTWGTARENHQDRFRS